MERAAKQLLRKGSRRQSPYEECFHALGEEHSEDVYRAIERLVQAGEQVGFTIQNLIRMLNDGMSLEALLDLIEFRMSGASVHAESTAA